MVTAETIIKNERLSRLIPLFKDVLKKRLLLLNQFELSKIKDFNLTKILRLQYIIENLLQYEVDESTIQKYVNFLMNSHSVLILNIASHKKNFELIVKSLYRENYNYLEILHEIIETLKCDHKIFVQVQENLNRAGLMDFIIFIIKKIELKNHNGKLIMYHPDKNFNKVDNLICFFQITTNFLALNPICYFSKLFPVNEVAERRKILRFFFAAYFQTNVTKISPVVLQLLQVILDNKKTAVDSDKRKEFFVNIFLELAEEFQIDFNSQILKLINVLMIQVSPVLIWKVIDTLQLIPLMINHINFRHHKKETALILKILSFMYENYYVWINDQWRMQLLDKLTTFIVHKRNNMATSQITYLLQHYLNKDDDTKSD